MPTAHHTAQIVGKDGHIACHSCIRQSQSHKLINVCLLFVPHGTRSGISVIRLNTARLPLILAMLQANLKSQTVKFCESTKITTEKLIWTLSITSITPASTMPQFNILIICKQIAQLQFQDLFCFS